MSERSYSEHIWSNGSIVAEYGTTSENENLLKRYSRGRGGEIIDYSYTNTPKASTYSFNYERNTEGIYSYNGHGDVTSLGTYKEGSMLFEASYEYACDIIGLKNVF